MEARQEPTRAEAIIGLSLSGKLLAMPANGATNALAYQATELIMTVKSFIIQDHSLDGLMGHDSNHPHLTIVIANNRLLLDLGILL